MYWSQIYHPHVSDFHHLFAWVEIAVVLVVAVVGMEAVVVLVVAVVGIVVSHTPASTYNLATFLHCNWAGCGSLEVKWHRSCECTCFEAGCLCSHFEWKCMTNIPIGVCFRSKPKH